jgi:hypothetical protein
MSTTTLEHKVLGPGDFAANAAELQRWDSIAEIQARRAGKPSDQLEPTISPEDMRRQRFYGSDAPAYSMRDGNHVLELYDLNNDDYFPDKSEFVSTLRRDGNYFSKLPDLEDRAGVINLSDEKFKEHVTRDNDAYSHITFQISDVVEGKKHFEETYGTEAAKLFSEIHGEEVYSEEGVKGRFREGLTAANIYFLNQEVTVAQLDGKEEGTKLLSGAFLGGLGAGSDVGLGYRFYVGDAHVSVVVEKSGAAGDEKMEPNQPTQVPYDKALEQLETLVPKASPLHAPLRAFVDGLYNVK